MHNPGIIFEGKVTEVRLEPTVTNNVVTYTIIISAPNPDYKLMPGMTAETNIYVVEKKELLVVPSKALRFSPDMKLLISYMKSQPKPEIQKVPNTMEIPKNGDFMPTLDINKKNGTKVVWVKNDLSIRAMPVETGLDDDINVEIINGINLGDEVILKMEEQDLSKKENLTAGSNPFMPRPPRRKR